MNLIMLYPWVILTIGIIIIGGVIFYFFLEHRRFRERNRQHRCARCNKELDDQGYEVPTDLDLNPSRATVTMCPKCAESIKRLYLLIYRLAVLGAVAAGVNFMWFLVDNIHSRKQVGLNDLASSGIFGCWLIAMFISKTLRNFRISKT